MFMWICAALNVSAFAVLVLHMRSYAARQERIDTLQDLRNHQRFVTTQMLGSLLIMALMLAIPVLVVVDESRSGVFEMGWGPIVLVSLPMVFRKAISATDEACRSLPTAPHLSRSYDAINRVWVAKALPLFAPLSAEKFESTDAAAPVHTHCTRCGGFYDQNANAGTVCSDCRAFYQRARAKGTPSERATRRAATLLSGLGTVEVIAGLLHLSISVDPWPIERAFAIAGITLGTLTFVGSLLWSWLNDPGRKLSLLAAILHLPLLPIGTVVGLYALIVAIRHSNVTQQAYSDVVRHTGSTSPLSQSLVPLLLTLLVVPAHAASIAGMHMGIMLAADPPSTTEEFTTASAP